MKKIWVYLLGVLSGAVVAIIALAIIGVAINAKNDPGSRVTSGMSFFEEPGDVVETSSVKVLRVLSDGAALAECKGEDNSTYFGLKVLLYNEDAQSYYYDDQIVKVPENKCFRRVGVYRKGERTIPIVMILDK